MRVVPLPSSAREIGEANRKLLLLIAQDALDWVQYRIQSRAAPCVIFFKGLSVTP